MKNIFESVRISNHSSKTLSALNLCWMSPCSDYTVKNRMKLTWPPTLPITAFLCMYDLVPTPRGSWPWQKRWMRVIKKKFGRAWCSYQHRKKKFGTMTNRHSPTSQKIDAVWYFQKLLVLLLRSCICHYNHKIFSHIYYFKCGDNMKLLRISVTLDWNRLFDISVECSFESYYSA